MSRPTPPIGALVRFNFAADQATISGVEGYVVWTPVAEGDSWIIEVAPDRQRRMYIQRFVYMEILQEQGDE